MKKPSFQLTVTALEDSLDFYVNILGFKIESFEPNKKATISLDNNFLTLNQSNSRWGTAKLSYPCGVGIMLQFETDSLDKIYQQIENREYPLYDQYYPDSEQDCILSDETRIILLDPDGYLLALFAKN